MYDEDKSFAIDELLFIYEILQKADEKLKLTINSNVDRFVQIVLENSKIRGMKWDDIILRFEWSFEADKIMEFANSRESNLK